MSHELCTPLNAIIACTELLSEECEDLGQQDFLPDLGKIQSAGKHLLTLISGILDLSKVEAGRMTMFLEDFDVATMIKHGGKGLGLALSREFCRMMRGHITVVSEIGKGSTFTVTLPVRCTDAETQS